ncbi:MAG: sarcosine oxidase subunit delta [Alphaproteobacteria bacterium]|nr:sarcosine oxidase subunit delta [Alphaproteobacteria bacterium]MCY4318534.1 sarcosine oxidase subunit delta [Alphaproteobacteria bacterium]
MMRIECPWCGGRDETEFHYGGEAHIMRPENPDALSDEAWADYLFMRANPKGVHAERWMHAQGCRRWFNVLRHTVSHEVVAVYPMGTPRPDLPETGA